MEQSPKKVPCGDEHDGFKMQGKVAAKSNDQYGPCSDCEPSYVAAEVHHVKVHSYDSFKRIIEGKTYHPAYIAPRSSLPSLNSPREALSDISKSSEHLRNDFHPHYKTGVNTSNTSWKKMRESSTNNIEKCNHLDTKSKIAHGKPRQSHHCPQRTSTPLSKSKPSLKYDPIEEFNYYDQTIGRNRLPSNLEDWFQSRGTRSNVGHEFHKTNPSLAKNIGLGPGNQHLVESSKERQLQGRQMVEENYQNCVKSDNGFQRKISPVQKPRNKPKYERQSGIYATENEGSSASQSNYNRPKSDYILRPDCHDIKMRRGQGYVNSAYVDENYVKNFMRDSHQLGDFNTGKQLNANSSGKNIPESSNHWTEQSSTNMPFSRSSYLKMTVNDARKQRDELIELRKNHHKYKNKVRNEPSCNKFDRVRNEPSCDKFDKNLKSLPGEYSSNQHADLNCDLNEITVFKQQKKKTLSLPEAKSRSSLYLVSPRSHKSKQNDSFNIYGAESGVIEEKYNPRSSTRHFSRQFSSAVLVHAPPPSEDKKDDKKSPLVLNAGELTWEKMKRQISKTNTYQVQKATEKEIKKEYLGKEEKFYSKPRTHFTLSLFTLCFCLSPLGLIAMLLAVCSASAYKDKDPELGRKLSKASMILSVVGILSTIAIAAILIGTNTIPVLGRYEEHRGNY